MMRLLRSVAAIVTEAVTLFGIEYATKQCQRLLQEGAPGLHFYTLNKARSTIEVLKNLGLYSRRSHQIEHVAGN